MGFHMASSTNHIKFLGAATLLLCIWFVFTFPHKSHQSYVPNFTGQPLPKQDTPHNGTKLSALDMLPLSEAEDYCARRRWPVYPHRGSRRKVYDLMLINTELEWLSIRMGQMASHVDFFVIIEADKTFTDTPKPLHVRENWDLFKDYHHKMIRHTLNMDNVEFDGTWGREGFSRDAMYDQVIPYLEGEQEAFKGDVLLVSDVDEIPRPDAIVALRNCDFPEGVTIHTKMYYYGFQWAQRNDWPHPQATFYNFDDTVLPDTLRGIGEAGDHIYNGGWHCSYCFPTVQEMVTKIKSFSHTELDKEEFTDRDKIVERVRTGKDMFDREEEPLDRVEDNPDVPRFLRRNAERYSYMLDRDPKNANFRDVEVKRGSAGLAAGE
ncbi:Beta-1,4-mannosyl-glycoprotein 4-beta-N-acetylglucosaminyltransferase [Lachnellula suecica]|uniref:Beta-1,4-mannosyl-glycoprotein 4-beta-N-acetylglucosaminyltransferase n=1 Tax=Lachnellula suecica TaxID=602035 RepID=A0A8T9C849_9HELO|nr:Beta-1,4-mannosyl-glycoprotein 4-beta-N-acetylglucosaminyltransferase [Lachnellula suecica]